MKDFNYYDSVYKLCPSYDFESIYVENKIRKFIEGFSSYRLKYNEFKRVIELFINSIHKT